MNNEIDKKQLWNNKSSRYNELIEIVEKNLSEKDMISFNKALVAYTDTLIEWENS